MLPRFALLNNKIDINNEININNVFDIKNGTDIEEKMIKSFNDINQLKTYIKALTTKYYICNKKFIESTTDINKLIDGFIQYITDHPQEIANVLNLDVNINRTIQWFDNLIIYWNIYNLIIDQ